LAHPIDNRCSTCYIQHMAAITLRDISADLRNKYKAILAEQGKNMKQDLVDYMKRTVEEASKKK
jgi:hypothetical protein